MRNLKYIFLLFIRLNMTLQSHPYPGWDQCRFVVLIALHLPSSPSNLTKSTKSWSMISWKMVEMVMICLNQWIPHLLVCSIALNQCTQLIFVFRRCFFFFFTFAPIITGHEAADVATVLAAYINRTSPVYPGTEGRIKFYDPKKDGPGNSAGKSTSLFYLMALPLIAVFITMRWLDFTC